MGTQDKFGLVGNTIANTFRVDEVIAEGGFGVVYRAFHLHFRAAVALKCLKIPGDLTEKGRRSFLEQFRTEAEIQFRLSARLSEVVRPLHVDALQTIDGQFVPFMALEWLEGMSVEGVIERRTFEGKDPMGLVGAMKLIRPAAMALGRAHHFETEGGTLCVVHRDIKPANLFIINEEGQNVVKILDFGISEVRQAATQLAGPIYGTSGNRPPFSPAYGAPEQWVPKEFGPTGPWTDVWGLALTLGEIIKGDPIIEGNLEAMMAKCLNPQQRPTPRGEGVAVSDEVESVFLRALSLDSRRRFQSIEDFWSALETANAHDAALSHSCQFVSHERGISLPPMSAPLPRGKTDSFGLPYPPSLNTHQINTKDPRCARTEHAVEISVAPAHTDHSDALFPPHQRYREPRPSSSESPQLWNHVSFETEDSSSANPSVSARMKSGQRSRLLSNARDSLFPKSAARRIPSQTIEQRRQAPSELEVEATSCFPKAETPLSARSPNIIHDIPDLAPPRRLQTSSTPVPTIRSAKATPAHLTSPPTPPARNPGPTIKSSTPFIPNALQRPPPGRKPTRSTGEQQIKREPLSLIPPALKRSMGS